MARSEPAQHELAGAGAGAGAAQCPLCGALLVEVECLAACRWAREQFAAGCDLGCGL
jgi:hypothetical protein